MTIRRRTVLFSGRVQGVRFRFTACEVARPFNVTGFVRNLPDGRVELVAEGDRAELDTFVKAVSNAMSGFNRDTEVSESDARGEFDGFDIRY